MPAAYFPVVRREPYLTAFWRLNDVAGALDVTDYGSRYDLIGTYATSQVLGPALIQADAGAASSLFGGTDAYASVSDAAPLRITGDLSIEAWVAPYTASQTCVLAGKMNSGLTVAAPYALLLASGQLRLALGNGSSQATLTYATALPVSIPTHVVATSFRGALALYVNGQPVITGALGSQSVSDGGQSFYLGHGFSGLLAEVALYHGALSAHRVARHFAVGQQVLSDPAHYRLVDPPTIP